MRKLVFIVGESGCGKSFLQKSLLKEHPETFSRITSITTRKPREGEVDGVDYHFRSQEELHSLMIADEMVQVDKFGGNYYGTTISEYIKDNPVGLFVCTPQGITDSIEALEEQFDFEYHIVYFATSNKSLYKNKVSKERINRGSIRMEFMKMKYANLLDKMKITQLYDSDIHNSIYKKVAASIMKERYKGEDYDAS